MVNKLFLIHNAKIWKSGRVDNSWMVFDQDDGYIREIGRDQAPVSKFSEDARRDCGGRRVFPGFHEAHIHLTSTGRVNIDLDLNGCSSIQELQERLKKYATKRTKSSWIFGNAWEQGRLGRMPSKEDLDSVCPDNPVFLFRVCHHIGVANTKALDIAGITRDSVSPDGSAIDKYQAGHIKEGELTGILREHGAFCKITDNMVYSTDDNKAAIREAMKVVLSHGVTSAQSNDDTWKEFCELADDNLLPVRVFHTAYFRDRDLKGFPFAGEQRGQMLSCDRVKMFADGAMGSATAALSIPYPGTENKGIILHSQEEFNSMMKEATGLGFRVEVHVIGDSGAEMVLKALEAAGVAPQKRPILTHCQILRKDLIERMQGLGVIANIQPQFVNTDGQWLDDLLPKELMEYAYTWKTLLRNGIACSGGSDSPVEEPRPMLGIYDSIFRRVGQRRRDNQNRFKPGEALTVKEAVDMYTIGGAFAAYQEHRLGQLRAGFQADFVIIQGEEDPVCNPELFATAKVGEVWVAGKQRL